MSSADSVAHLSPSPNAPRGPARPSSSDYTLAHLSDADLLLGTRGCVARSNHQLAALLAHLAEVEVRGIYRQRACASLCTFCIYELRMSEDSAFRHARAARIARQFPVLFGLIAAGEIHLSGVVLIGPHLTEENHRELLLRVKHRSKREIIKVVRLIDPLPDVPPRIEPLGPAPSAQPQTSSTWQEFLDSRLPVRELPPGQRPADWLELGAEISNTTIGDSETEASETEASETEASERSGPAKVAACPAAQRYKIQFQASQEYVDLLEKATDLLPYAVRSRALEEVHLRAMRLLVAELEKRKYALTKHPRAHGFSMKPEGNEPARNEPARNEPARNEPAPAADTCSGEPTELNTNSTTVAGVSRFSTPETPRRRGSNAGRIAGKNQGARVESGSDEDEPSAVDERTPRRRGRYVPSEARRTVRERDDGRCTYVAADGTRCRETSCLEVHHLDPYSRGGPPTAENLTLRCRPHNALAAEEDFGRAHMARKLGRD